MQFPAPPRIARVLVVPLAVFVGALWSPAAHAANPSFGPVPATSNAVTLSATPTDGLTDGSTVTFTVTTSGSTHLIGSLSAHLCQHGFASYTSASFGYSGSSGSRCVYSQFIVGGGLDGADYETVFGPYSGSESTSGSLQVHVGTGSVTWGNSTGDGPFTLTADSTHQVDLVLQVNLVGDTTPVTYFIQPLSFAAPTAASPGSCNGAQLVGTYTPALTNTDQPETLVLKVTKDPTNGNTVNGGTCSTPVNGTLHPKAITAKLSGVTRCIGSPDAGSYPLNGKLQFTMVETTLNPKTNLPVPFVIQTFVSVAGLNPSASDVLDFYGVVTKGVGVGKSVSGSLFADAATKNAKSDPPTVTGYHLDAAKQTACAAGTGSVDTILMGDGSSPLGGIAAGLSFTFGK